LLDRDLIEQLKKSRVVIGEQAPLIVDFDGEVLSGLHRKEAGWQKSESVDSKVIAEKLGVTIPAAKEIVRMHFNLQRKPSREETEASLLKIARELEVKGVQKELIASEVSKLVPYSDRWVRELLPEEYKQPEQVEAAKHVAEVVPPEETEIPEKPSEVSKALIPVICEANCGMTTVYPKDWKGQQVCPSCYEKLSRGEITVEPPKPRIEEAPKPPGLEKRIYEPGAWREEMHKPVSRMDEFVRNELIRLGYRIRSQEPVCIKSIVPEAIVDGKGDKTFEKPFAVFLDTVETHGKRTLVDMENRELLAKKGIRVLEIQYDSYTEEQRQLVMSEITSAL